MKNIILKVDGMMCMNCAKHVENACLSISGVKGAKVDLKKKTVTVELNEEVSTNTLIEAIEKAGYKAKEK